MIPELKLNDEVVLSGSPMALGEEVNFAFSVTMPTYGTKVHRSPVVAGSYLAVAVVGGSVAPQRLTALQSQIEATKTTLESGDATAIGALTREHLLGDMFYAGTLGYFAQYTAIGQIAGLQQKAQVLLMPSGGTYGYEPNVNYFFGVPRAIEAGGVVMDLDRVATAVGTSAGNQQQQYNFVLQLGVLSSALEHAVPEQMFSTSASPADAVSAVKALSKAAAAGQRIYHLTPANQALTLPHIGHDAATMAEIRAALAVGKEVITHTNAIAVPGWSGAGYIIFDPETGAGAYKIGGGANGSFLDYVFDNGLPLSLAALFLSLLGAASGVAFFFFFIAMIVAVFTVVLVAMATHLAILESGCPHQLADLYVAFEVAALTVALFSWVGVLISGFISFLAGGAVTGSTPACQNLS